MGAIAQADATPRHSPGAVFAEGFHAPELEHGRPFRWMAQRGRLNLSGADGCFLELWVRAPFWNLSQHVTLTLSGSRVSHPLVYGWNVLSLALPPGCESVDLETDKLFPPEAHPGDARELGVQVRVPELHGDSERHIRLVEQQAGTIGAARRAIEGEAGAGAVRWGQGFHHEEFDEGLPLRWMARSGRLEFEPDAEERFLELRVASHFYDRSQRLVVTLEPGDAAEFALARGWNALSLRILPGSSAVALGVDRSVPARLHPGDERDLALRVRPGLLHRDANRHESVSRRWANRIMNLDEMLAGLTTLESYPPKLGIDMQGACNVKPACVYCAWDWNKQLEGDNVDLPFDLSTLAEYGAHFEHADELVNCSIGEPFMMPQIDALLDEFGRRGQVLELTTNGMILTQRNIDRLLGREAHLYISIDAATAATFARLRNNMFDRIIENVRRLVNAKGGPGQLPLVYLVFMPMKANAHEADAFVELCAELRVDRMVLRPLNRTDLDLTSDRGGYHWSYQDEILPWPELVRISGRVAELCRQHGVDLADQMNFGGDLIETFATEYAAGRREAEARQAAVPPRPAVPALSVSPPPRATETSTAAAPPLLQDLGAAEPNLGQAALPLCTEPWTSLYILRRGVMPCCYGGRPIAAMTDYREAWNGPLMRSLRTELAAGRFHRYCFESPDCPIVQKSVQGHDLGPRQRAYRWSLRMIERVRAGWPGKSWRAARSAVGA